MNYSDEEHENTITVNDFTLVHPGTNIEIVGLDGRTKFTGKVASCSRSSTSRHNGGFWNSLRDFVRHPIHWLRWSRVRDTGGIVVFKREGK